MDYLPLSDVRKSLRIKWYRCPIEPSVLRELLKRSDLKGFRQAGGHFALWLVTGCLVYAAWANEAWLGLTLALFLHGVVASFFSGTAPHELGHGTVFRTPWLNRAFLYLFSLISWWDPFDYASSHTYHHRYTLHPEGDRENLLPLSPRANPWFVLQLFTISAFTPKGRSFGKGGVLSTVYSTVLGAIGRTGNSEISSNEWLDAIHTDQPAEFRRSVIWSRVLLVFHSSVVLLSLLSGQWVFIFIVSLSSFIARVFSYLVGMTQHCGLKENDPDFRKSTRSIVLNPVLEFLYWNMNWHTEHHMFAGVPSYNLKKLHHAVCDDMPQPRTLRQAWLEMSETWERQQTDSNYYFQLRLQTSLPNSPSHLQRDAAADDLLESMGDLAPKGLR